jgi:hypothetical protein
MCKTFKGVEITARGVRPAGTMLREFLAKGPSWIWRLS